MAAKRRRFRSRFSRGLYTYVTIFFFVVGFALIGLWLSLNRYQQDLDAEAAEAARAQEQADYEKAASRAPQLAFEDYVAHADAQTWADNWYATHPANYDDPAQVLAAKSSNRTSSV